MLHQHESSRGRHPSIAGHIGLLLLAIAIMMGLYAVSQSVTTTGMGDLILVAAHVAAAAGIFLVGRRFLSGMFSRMHGAPAQHAHTHHELETTGALIRWSFLYDLLTQLLTSGKYHQLQESVVALAAIQPGEKVLDVGCGPGRLVIIAKQKAGAAIVYGRDAAPEMIALAKQNAARAGVEVDLWAGLVEALDFSDNTLDVVISTFVFHHLPDDLKTRALSEIYRVLKPGGRHLLVEFEPPKKGLRKVFLTRLLGSGMMTIDTREIAPRLEAVGFTAITSGNAGHPLATYVLGRKPT